MSEEIKLIANRIQELREISGDSTERVAQLLGIEQSVYEGYEANGVDIPISVLYELANYYGVDFTEILTGKSPKLKNYCVARGGKGMGIDRYSGYHFESLAYKFVGKVMEPLMVTVDPDDTDHKLVVHPGQEFNYVVEGTVMVEFGDEQVILNEGDSIYFDPNLPHGQKAMNGKPAKFLTVITE